MKLWEAKMFFDYLQAANYKEAAMLDYIKAAEHVLGSYIYEPLKSIYQYFAKTPLTDIGYAAKDTAQGIVQEYPLTIIATAVVTGASYIAYRQGLFGRLKKAVGNLAEVHVGEIGLNTFMGGVHFHGVDVWLGTNPAITFSQKAKEMAKDACQEAVTGQRFKTTLTETVSKAVGRSVGRSVGKAMGAVCNSASEAIQQEFQKEREEQNKRDSELRF